MNQIQKQHSLQQHVQQYYHHRTDNRSTVKYTPKEEGWGVGGCWTVTLPHWHPGPRTQDPGPRTSSPFKTIILQLATNGTVLHEYDTEDPGNQRLLLGSPGGPGAQSQPSFQSRACY